MSRLSAATLADLEQPRDLKISLDGRHATYITQAASRNEASPKTTVWLAEVGKENSSKPWTKGNYHDKSPAFCPDGTQIAFLSDRTHDNGDMDLYYVSPLLPNVVKKAIMFSGYGAVEAFKWSHRGSHIVLNIRPESESETDVKVQGGNVKYRNLWLLDVEQGNLNRLLDEAVDVTDFDWNADDSEIVYATQPDADGESADYGQEIKVINVISKEKRFVMKSEYRVISLCCCRDIITMILTYKLQGFNHSFSVYQSKNGVFEHVAHGETNDATGLQSASGKPLILVFDKMRSQLRTLEETLYDVENNISGFDGVLEAEKSTLVVIKNAVDAPSEVYSVVNGEECKLSRHGEKIAGLKIASAHVVEYEEDGIPYSGCYAIPPQVQNEFHAKKPLPTVVVVHGGPYYRMTNEWDPLLLSPYAISLGYVVLMPNYRGSSGHGDEYASSVNGNPEVSYEDVVWLVKKGIEEGRIDKNRVAICGWSQGGFITYQAMANDSTFHFTAGMAGAGVSDWHVTAAASDITRWESSFLGYSLWDKEVAAEKLKRTNPIHGACNVRTPLLMIHGEEDSRVSPLNAILFSKALKACGNKDFEMALYPREEHGSAPKVWERAHFIDYRERMGRFFEKHLGKA